MLTVYLGSRFCWNNFFFRNIIIICGIFCFKMSKYMLSLTSSIRLTEYIPKSVIHANNARESVLWISNDSFFLVSLRLMNGYLQIVTISNLMYIRVKELEHKILLINTNKTEYRGTTWRIPQQYQRTFYLWNNVFVNFAILLRVKNYK